jgi:hypothetical protein
VFGIVPALLFAHRCGPELSTARAVGSIECCTKTRTDCTTQCFCCSRSPAHFGKPQPFSLHTAVALNFQQQGL